MSLSAKKNSGYKGYDVMVSQSYQTDMLPDLKEGFFPGTDMPPDDPRVLAKRFFAAPNVWPSADLLAPEEFRDPVEKYYQAVTQLCGVVLDLIAATLPYGPHVFNGFRAKEPACPLRLLHYSPTPGEDPEKRQLGSSAHTDFSAVALLLQDEREGLEVQNQATGEWVLVPPNKDAYVVNLGDMMHKLLSGKYKSSMHRVVLGGFGMNEKEEKVMTAEEYMFDRLNFSYGRHETKAST